MNPRELAMAADEARSRLGRGLASLIGDVGGEAAHVERPRNQRKVPIEFLKPNPRNPRRKPTCLGPPPPSASSGTVAGPFGRWLAGIGSASLQVSCHAVWGGLAPWPREKIAVFLALVRHYSRPVKVPMWSHWLSQPVPTAPRHTGNKAAASESVFVPNNLCQQTSRVMASHDNAT